MGSFGTKGKAAPLSTIKEIERHEFVERIVQTVVERPHFVVREAKAEIIERPSFETVDKKVKVEIPSYDLSVVNFHIEELVEKLRVVESRVPETIVKTEVVEKMPIGLLLFTIGLFFMNCLMIGDLLAHGN